MTDPELQARIAAFRAGACSNSAGSKAATCASTTAGPTADADRLRRHVADRSGSPPDVVIVATGTSASIAAQNGDHAPSRSCSRIVPIRSALGFVASLARPGGNVTGFTLFSTASWRQSGWSCCKEIAPGVTRVAVLVI